MYRVTRVHKMYPQIYSNTCVYLHFYSEIDLSLLIFNFVINPLCLKDEQASGLISQQLVSRKLKVGLMHFDSSTRNLRPGYAMEPTIL